jgi:hypothetical protein
MKTWITMRRAGLFGIVAAAGLACSACSVSTQPADADAIGSAGERASTLAAVSALDVTEGTIHTGSSASAITHFDVDENDADADAVRAVALDDRGAPLAARVASLEATYQGPTRTTSVLGSGAVRIQYGLKLLNADPCNLLYAMVRIANGRGRLVVQTKLNAGASTSADCGNGGYTDVGSLDLGPIAKGERHTLRATWNPGRRTMTIDFDHGAPLTVTLDAATVQRLGQGVGVRSDNAAWDFVLATSS